MQVPILTGVYSDESANIREAYPVNMVPVVFESGLSSGYLRTADGAVKQSDGEGVPRGGMVWNGQLYRVSGTSLVRIKSDGTYDVLGDVGPGGRVTMAYSFDRLAIASGGNLFYYTEGGTVQQVTDPDLGFVEAVVWIDGYFMCTDGQYMVVTDLSDPFSVNPLKYGSSEIDPDPIVTLLKSFSEIAAVNRYTIEFFYDAGGAGFPFARVSGAQIQKGALGTNCACVFTDTVAFLGGGRNETPGVYLGANGATVKISTPGIDALLERYTESELSQVVLETRAHKSHPQLWVRLPDRTVVYDHDATQATGKRVWYILTSAMDGFSEYRLVDPLWVYDHWAVCDAKTGAFGVMSEDISSVFGEHVRWEFSTSFIYNGGKSALIKAMEIVCLSGRVSAADDPMVGTQYTHDGEMWSQVRYIRSGIRGDRLARIAWLQQGQLRAWRAQRFVGDSRSRMAVARLELDVEALDV